MVFTNETPSCNHFLFLSLSFCLGAGFYTQSHHCQESPGSSQEGGNRLVGQPRAGHGVPDDIYPRSDHTVIPAALRKPEVMVVRQCTLYIHCINIREGKCRITV